MFACLSSIPTADLPPIGSGRLPPLMTVSGNLLVRLPAMLLGSAKNSLFAVISDLKIKLPGAVTFIAPMTGTLTFTVVLFLAFFVPGSDMSRILVFVLSPRNSDPDS